MKEIVVVSGKGGTGKTSVVASLAALAAGKAVIADCDVDAPDLHLILRPEIESTQDFSGMKTAAIDKSRCTECGLCQEHCRFKAIDGYEVDPELCEGCGVCRLVCPSDAIAMVDRISGRAYVSRTRYGPMVHAELFPGEEASGKLVTLVREMARNLAESRKLGLVLIDGSPGIGCPVIASLAGANLALIITEPTLSGEHDLRRVLRTVEHFGVEPVVCINKYDLNIESAGQIESLCNEMGVEIAGRLPFDTSVVEAMVQGRPVVELEGPASGAIKDLWRDLEPRL